VKSLKEARDMPWIEQIAYTVSHKSREKKFRLFLAAVKPLPQETILDIGVNNTEYSESDNYLEKHYPYPQHITVVSKEGLDAFTKRYPQIKAVMADGRSLPFPDNAFDISYSNAVIEHVGNREDQKHFLQELVRVAKRGYLTTPNKHFPIEVHTRIPLLHLLLSKKYFDVFLKKIGRGWAADNYMNLLSQSELETLLKEAGIQNYTLLKNRFFGFTMTFTVIWKK
jgi:trans-aconitate methyltransferase